MLKLQLIYGRSIIRKENCLLFRNGIFELVLAYHLYIFIEISMYINRHYEHINVSDDIYKLVIDMLQ